MLGSRRQPSLASNAALGRATGFALLVAGPLRLARYLEAMAHLDIAIATGGGGTNAAFLYDQAAP